MHQRDRQWITLIVWGVFTFLMLIVVTQLLPVQADYTGLWPASTTTLFAGPGVPTTSIEQMQEALTFAQNARDAVMAGVQASIQQQMVQRLPVAAVLTFLLTAAATISTWFIWRHAGLEAHLALKALDVEKQKRRGRIERFVEELGADELVELRSRLVEDDGLVKPLGEIVEAERRVNGT